MRYLIFLFLLSSCSIPISPKNPVIVSKIEYVQQTPFPLKPTQIEYYRKPIISSTDKDFVVTNEFVENSILLKKYADKVDAWKKENKVK